MLLAIDLSSILIKTGQFILSFSILVILHELGHFLPARWFKTRVDKFYLFFNPGFSLFKKKIGDTEYGLGWVPFGGYVKIAGMIDESMDKDQMKQAPQPWEFRSKPAWQRLIIMIGGVVVNILLALVLFIMITFVWGDTYVPLENAKYGIYADSLGRKIGLQSGDKIVSLDNRPVESLDVVPADIVLNEVSTIQLIRNGEKQTINIPSDFVKDLNKSRLQRFISYRFPVVVDSVTMPKNFIENTLLKNDTIVGINHYPAPFYHQFDSLKKKYENQEVLLQVVRAGEPVDVKVKLSGTSVGFLSTSPYTLLGSETKKYSLIESVPAGISRCFETLGKYVTGLKQIFTGKVAAKDSLGSVISIGNTFPGVWDWEKFWTLTAIFSIILAFMNILPIPALDGGHALFTLYEMITGKKPGDKFMEIAQMVGMILLIGLMAYALGLDFWRMFTK